MSFSADQSSTSGTLEQARAWCPPCLPRAHHAGWAEHGTALLGDMAQGWIAGEDHSCQQSLTVFHPYSKSSQVSKLALGIRLGYVRDTAQTFMSGTF